MINEDMRKLLEEPFSKDAIKQRKADGNSGRMLDYVEGHSVLRRLNSATNGTWDFKVTAIDSTEIGKDKNGSPRLLWKVRGAVTIPGMGTRENIGVQVASMGTGEDLLKGAITDCIKRCATLFGVGLELYGPDYESDEYEAAHAEPVARPRAVAQSAPQARAEPPRQRTAPASPDGLHTWNEFWPLAKSKGYNDQAAVEAFFGHPLQRDAHAAYMELRELTAGGSQS